MSEERDLLELGRIAVDAARPGEEVEAFVEWGRETDIRVYEGEVERLTSAESRGLGVRLIAGDRLGYAFAADPSPGEVAALVEQARANASLATPREGNVLPEPHSVEPLDGLYLPEIESTEPAGKVALALDADRLTAAADPRIRAVPQTWYGEAVGRAAIVSTRGVAVSALGGGCWLVALALAGEGDETQSGYAVDFARRLQDLDAAAVAAEAAERACALLGARKPRTERLPVIFDPMSAGDLVGVLAAPLNAEAVLKGRSLLAGKVGERVASEAFTLADDGRDVRGVGAAPFDDEGTPTRRTPVIERGVLTGYLHNTSTAVRMGERSTGNARRAGFKSAPGVAPINLIVEAGEDSFDALLARAGRALIVREMAGIHSGVNPISGDFSVGVSGQMVDGGAIAGAVREATVAGSMLDMLAGIAAVGSDLRVLPASGVATPSILIGELTVSGS